MKFLPSTAVFALLSVAALADIQDPPMNDQGPTRKLSRGLANITFGITELPVVACEVNEAEGNSTGFSYGGIKGLGRVFARIGFGLYDVFTFPFPSYHGSYTAPYKSSIPWINGGFDEFPPELGWESRYNYSRSYAAHP